MSKYASTQPPIPRCKRQSGFAGGETPHSSSKRRSQVSFGDGALPPSVNSRAASAPFIPRRPRRAIDQQLDVDGFKFHRLRERIDRRNRDAQRIAPRQVKRSPRRRGDAHPIHDADLVGSDALRPDPHRRGLTAVGSDHRAGQDRIDPLGTMQSRGGKARQDTRRRERSQQAFARNTAVSSASLDTYTSWCSATYRLRSSWRDSWLRGQGFRPPRNGSVMAEVCRRSPRHPDRGRNRQGADSGSGFSPWRYATSARSAGQISAPPHRGDKLAG